MKLVTVEEMRAIEEEADQQGLSYAQMMENAGSALAQRIEAEYSLQLPNHYIVGLVGSGNNGGDTLIALETLAKLGWQAEAYLAMARPSGDTLVNRLREAGGNVYSAAADGNGTTLQALIEKSEVVLDGVLGTGARLPLRKELADFLYRAKQMIQRIQARRDLVVVAVDCPSGIDANTGEAAAEVIPANRTICMAALKAGLLKLPAYELAGEIETVDIGIPTDLPAWKEISLQVIDDEFVRANLPERKADAHKGTFGTAFIVAGSVNYTGAALLAGRAAYRIGAGLVTLAVPGMVHVALAGHLAEATWVLLPSETGVIAESAAEVVRKNLEKSTAMLLGPGWGQEETTQHFLTHLLSNTSVKLRGTIGFLGSSSLGEESENSPHLPPLVIDADALKLLKKIPDWAKVLPPDTILTPHPGEMSILTEQDIAAIQADRVSTAQKYSREWGHVVVLKGAFTVVAAPDGGTAIIPVASAALARAGTGDVLAGLITGLRAQGVPAFEAAAAGSWLHAKGGLIAANWAGNEASVLAGDVLDGAVEMLSSCARSKR